MNALTTTAHHDLAADVAIVCAAGALTLSNASQLRGVLLTYVADCPSAVIVDLSRCSVDNASALTVFPAVARRQVGRPAVAIVVCGAGQDFVGGAAVGALANVRAFDSCGEALVGAEVSRLAQPRRTLRLERTPSAPAQARAVVDSVCDEWNLELPRVSAVLIISELVTNAFRHAEGEIHIEAMLREDFLHLRVLDGSITPPVAADVSGPDMLLDHGRGIAIVARCSSAWGFMIGSNETGKVVWASIRALPPGR